MLTGDTPGIRKEPYAGQIPGVIAVCACTMRLQRDIHNCIYACRDLAGGFSTMYWRLRAGGGVYQRRIAWVRLNRLIWYD